MSGNTISGTVSYTVTLGSGNSQLDLTVAANGRLTATYTAVYGSSLVSNASLVNFGILEGTVDFHSQDTLVNWGSIGAPFDGVNLRDGGFVDNYGVIGMPSPAALGVKLNDSTLVNSGTIGIAGVSTGVFADYEYGYSNEITNSGIIFGAGVGIVMAGTTLNNSGSIIGGGTAIEEQGSAPFIIDNSGFISGSRYGLLGNTGTVDNDGVISANLVGVTLGLGSAQLINEGTISGYVAVYDSSAGLDLTVLPGAAFHGAVKDGGGSGVLDLASSTSTGTLDISSFTGFSDIDFASGSTWILEGNGTQLTSSESISGFASGDTIVFDGFAATSDSFVAGAGLVLSDGTLSETLAIAGSFATGDFAVSTLVPATQITFTDAAPCFCPGTRILTSRGKIPVETLVVGDLVKTAVRGFQPIRWIGRRAYDGRFIAGNHLALPVKIRRHALGFNVPSRDLHVSPGHAICEGRCIGACVAAG